MRYETEIGYQAQLDWKENMKFTLINGKVISINIFVLILSYSRFRVYRLSLSKTQDVLFSFINDAFETFEGVPKELLTDNMKTVMDDARTEYKKGKANNKFQQKRVYQLFISLLFYLHVVAMIFKLFPFKETTIFSHLYYP